MIKYRFYIPENSRICQKHLSEKNWSDLLGTNISNTFTSHQIENIIDNLRDVCLSNKSILNFEFFDDLSDDEIHKWTNLNKIQFAALLNDLPTLVELEKKFINTALASFLIKLKTGLANDLISSLVNIPRRSLEILMNKARESLLKDFVPKFLGIQINSREKIKENSSVVANNLFLKNNNENIITIWDGTYIYIQKSSNYIFQRKSYSIHKSRQLLKPFLAVAANGYIIDVFGPYNSNDSDSKILNNLMKNDSFVSFFRPGDVFLVDRGFRDSIDLLRDKLFVPLMPEFILRGQSQLSCSQANKSRLITKCRFVIESVNGRLKQSFKYFHNTFQNKSLEHLLDDFKIAAPIYNAHFKRIYSDIDDSIDISNKMIALQNKDNKLHNLVESRKLNCTSLIFC